MIEQIILNAFATAIGYYLISLALFGQFSYLKLISISLVTSLVVGAYSANITFLLFNNPFISLVAGIVSGGILGYIGAVMHLIIGREKEVFGLFASIGLFIIIQGIITIFSGGGVEPFKLTAILTTDKIKPDWLILGIIISVITTVVLLLLYKKTNLGLKAIATGDNFELALLLKQNPSRIETLVQVISGFIAGLAGIMIAFDKGLQPDLGFDFILKAFAILIITRLNIQFLFFWSFILAIVEHTVTFYYGGQLGQAAGLTIVVIIVFYSVLNKWLIQKKIKNNLEKTLNV